MDLQVGEGATARQLDGSATRAPEHVVVLGVSFLPTGRNFEITWFDEKSMGFRNVNG
jgi:hypothetical protein